jgi:phage minor structural protein
MIPRLFSGDATNFNTVGLGTMTGTLSCTVTEERNGIYELDMTVLATTPVYNNLKVGNLVVALTSEGTKQAFEIYEITKPMDSQIHILAQHISYRASFIPVRAFTAVGITATLAGLMSNSLETNPFTLTTNLTNESSTYSQNFPKSLRSCLGGSLGSVLDVFSGGGSGEYLWDNYTISFLSRRGSDKGVQFRYGKNITEFEVSNTFADVVTGAMAYWQSEDQTVTVNSNILYTSTVDDYPNRRTVVIDATSEFQEEPSISDLDVFVASYLNSAMIAPLENITLSYVDLSNTDEQAIFESVKLCDTVHVIYAPMNISFSAKVIRTVWNVLQERYDEIEIGQTKSSLSKTLAGTAMSVSELSATSANLVTITGGLAISVSDANEDIAKVSGTVETHSSSIETNAKNIESTAREFNQFKTNDFVETNEKVSKVTQKAESIDFEFSETKKVVDANHTYVEEAKTNIGFDANGVTVGNSASAVRGVFGNSSLDFIDKSNTRLAWLDADEGLGASQVSIGDPTSKALRWNLKVSKDGKHFRIFRHE